MARTKLTVCLLTFNSMRTLPRCLEPILTFADEIVVVDSGSTDGTLEYLRSQGLDAVYRPYDFHSNQMNYAISLSSNDWVLCMDSDEFLDPETIGEIERLKDREKDPSHAYRITRYWRVLGREVHAIYPVSSPDHPVRLFDRRFARFNGEPVDDKPKGHTSTSILPGHVVHDTFFDIHEVFHKLNKYTSTLVTHKNVDPSLPKAFFNPFPAFIKWYFFKGAYRDGRVGVVTGVYASLYTFLKYFKAWYGSGETS